MKNCPECATIIGEDQQPNCPKCGHQFTLSPGVDDDELDFVVTEAAGADPEFVGGSTGFGGKGASDDLGIESTSDLMENEAHNTMELPTTGTAPLSDPDLSPIGDSSPPLPPTQSEQNEENVSTSPIADKVSVTDSGQVKKLSPDEVKEVERRLYGKSSGYLSDREKNEIVGKMNESGDQPFANTPIEPPQRNSDTPEPVESHAADDADFTAPAMAGKGKGIAYYYRNFIQLTGSQQILPKDEITVGGRDFELRPRQFNGKVAIGTAIGLFIIILVFVGTLFTSSKNTGVGEIAGIVLDETNQPYLRGATVRLPESNLSIESNPQGLFHFANVPEGTHKLEYIVNGRIAKTDYATVVNNQSTLIALRHDEAELGQVDPTPPEPKRTKQAVAKQEPAIETKAPVTKNNPATTTRKKKSSFAKLTLSANVDNARLELDGNTLGAGNTTFSRIKPGRHEFTVSLDGYKAKSGIIDLKAGEKKRLKISLDPLEVAEMSTGPSARDYYDAGIADLRSKKIDEALEAFSQAIESNPGHADAYFYRGDAYAQLKDSGPAHDDYLRAAEIYQFQNDYNASITGYNRAIKINKKSVAAHLGRGYVYLSKGEERAAIADFEAAKKYDKRNAQAHFGLGEARFRQNNYKKAIKHFKDARQIDPTNPLVYQFLMLSHLAKGDIKDVKKSFEKFKTVASEQQYTEMLNDKRFTAVFEVLDR